MYAVIETGGKQYRVEVGTELAVDLLDAEPGQAITFDRVLLVGDGDDTSVGQPTVADAAVEAEVVRRDRGEKLIVFKYRPKARTRVKKGHRQDHLVLRITDVKLKGRSAAEENRKADDDARTERQRLEEAAARQAAADAELATKLAKRKDAADDDAPKGRRSAKATTSESDGDASAATAAKTPRRRAEAAPAKQSTTAAKSEDTGSRSTSKTKSTSTDEPAPKRGREKKDG
jgi:large subunit ribosomal protein L21